MRERVPIHLLPLMRGVAPAFVSSTGNLLVLIVARRAGNLFSFISNAQPPCAYHCASWVALVSSANLPSDYAYALGVAVSLPLITRLAQRGSNNAFGRALPAQVSG